jgi:hypothetical protein
MLMSLRNVLSQISLFTTIFNSWVRKSSILVKEFGFGEYWKNSVPILISKEEVDRVHAVKVAKNPAWFKEMHHKTILELYYFSSTTQTFDSKKAIHLDAVTSGQFTAGCVSKVRLDQTSVVSAPTAVLQEFPISAILQELDHHLEDDRYQFHDSLLYRSLKEVKFESLRDVFRLSHSSPLSQASKFNVFFPWDCEKYDLHKMQNMQVHEERYCGVLSDSTIAMHFIKFRRLLASVKKSGILPYRKTLVEGFVLSREGKIHFLTTRGIHRALVFRYLGHKEMYARKDQDYVGYVDFADIESWYFVRNGFCSIKDAAKIFDAFFDQPDNKTEI